MERNRYVRLKTRGTEGAEQGKTEATVTKATAEGRQRRTYDPPVCRKDYRSGWRYRAGGSGMEESADESAKWGGE